MIDRYSLSPMKDLWGEEAKFQSWLDVEIAVCEQWAKLGRIPAADLKRIKSRAKLDVPRIEEIEAETRHDVIAFTTQLAEKIGKSSRFVHMGLTSSDVVDTALALRLKKASEIIGRDLAAVDKALLKLARWHAYTPMMGRTHGMHAEPTTFGLKTLVWREEVQRHQTRFGEASADIAVGKISGAVGTAVHTGIAFEEAVCRRLGLKPDPVSTQVVSRDRHASFLCTLGLIAGTVEKIATEIRHLQRPEIRELEEPFRSGQKGSSAMPHKRNPVQCEQLTGLARVLRVNVIPGLENIALWGERDISHSSVERVVLADSCILADYVLVKLARILEGLTVNVDKMRENIGLTRGLVFSQKVLLELVNGGLTREQAYAAVQAAAMRTWHGGDDFAGELLQETEVAKKFDRAALEALFDVEPFFNEVEAIYARCGVELPKRVKAKAPSKS